MILSILFEIQPTDFATFLSRLSIIFKNIDIEKGDTGAKKFFNIAIDKLSELNLPYKYCDGVFEMLYTNDTDIIKSTVGADIPDTYPESEKILSIMETKTMKNKVFIVHGHDEAMKQEVARFVEKFDIKTIILDEQVNQGKTIIEKLEDYAKEVDFAIILYSPDDELKDGKKRARQNVVFEHGYFMGKLGRGNVVALVKDSNVEILSDLSGVVYISFEKNWENELAKEMRECGLPADLNKIK